MKTILLIIDGLGDESIPQLGGKTPLEAAKTPNLDLLAGSGNLGQVIAFRKDGKLPTSEDSHLAMFGYNPEEHNLGRGIFEATGAGLDIQPADVCLRGNFCTVDENGLIVDRRAGRIEKTAKLIKALSGIEIDGIKFIIKQSFSYRVGIIMRGVGLSPKISDSDPGSGKSGVLPQSVVPLNDSSEALFTSRVVNDFCEIVHSRLKDLPENRKRKLPANYLLIRGAASLEALPSFNELYNLKPCCVAAGPTYRAVGKMLGMDLITVKGATASLKTNLKGKIAAVVKNLGKYDFVFCHIKAADTLAEEGKFADKKTFIEKIDKNLKPLLSLKNTLLVVSSDHSTCSLLKRHCDVPCPLLFCALPVKGKIGEKFSEKNCQNGKLGTFPQLGLMRRIITFERNL